MAYPVISSRRLPYDIDGSEVGWAKDNSSYGSATRAFDYGIQTWLSEEDKTKFNSINSTKVYDPYMESVAFWFFFPESVEVEMMAIRYDPSQEVKCDVAVQGSQDSTNGMDGTWETATVNIPQDHRVDGWRKNVVPVSLSSSIKVMRVGFSGDKRKILGIHIYGRKAVSETPDDILFCDVNGNELTSLIGWGDRPEGTTKYKEIKIKNASTNKIANTVNLQLNHSDFLMSWNPDGPWVGTLDIESIGAGSLSSTIYLRNKLGPPLLKLGPDAGRIIATVGGWS